MPPKAKTDGNFLFFQERGMPRDLPDLYVPGWYVEMIDASDSVLVSGIFVSLTFLIWASPCLFLDFIFLGSLFILQLTNLDNCDRKQERRRKSMHRSILLSLEKTQRPARIDSPQFWTEKNQVCPGIRTQLARTECHSSTACATTALRPFCFVDICSFRESSSCSPGFGFWSSNFFQKTLFSQWTV